jgi:hypothetical protein
MKYWSKKQERKEIRKKVKNKQSKNNLKEIVQDLVWLNKKQKSKQKIILNKTRVQLFNRLKLEKEILLPVFNIPYSGVNHKISVYYL